MVFLIFRLKSESSWICLSPSPKYQFLTEVFIDVQISCTFRGECLLAGSRKVYGGSDCLPGVWEPGKARWVVSVHGAGERTDGLRWRACFLLGASANCWPQLCLLFPFLMSTQPWTSLNVLELGFVNTEKQEPALCLFPLTEKCTEVLGMRLTEVVTTHFNFLPS